MWGHSPSQPEGVGGVEAKGRAGEPLLRATGAGRGGTKHQGCDRRVVGRWNQLDKGWEERPCHRDGRAQ